MTESFRIEKQARPLSPRLSIYRWHPAMLASIAHRASGLLLIVFVPVFLFLLYGMVGSEEAFAAISGLLHTPLGKLMLWLVGLALAYHWANGLRFLLIDAGIGEGRAMLRIGAQAVLIFAALMALILGVILW